MLSLVLPFLDLSHQWDQTVYDLYDGPPGAFHPQGLPRAVVEAMSRALPALGARTGGIPELLGEDCIFPRKGVDAIAEKLRQLSLEQMISMAESNFAHAKMFQKELLEKKRFEFYSAFAAAAKEKQK